MDSSTNGNLPMKPNLEFDLFNNDTILEKCKHSLVYSQNLYAALCNNRFFYNEEEWTCSWRHAGSIVAEIVGEGDYTTYYCSGNESVVTEEISLDLMKLGWTIKPYEPKLPPGEYRNEW